MIGRHPVFEPYPSPYRDLAEEYQREREWKSHLQEKHSQTWRRPESLNYRTDQGKGKPPTRFETTSATDMF